MSIVRHQYQPSSGKPRRPWFTVVLTICVMVVVVALVILARS